MKSEELLNSLDYIGEDLLGEAEQTILVKSQRPWLKTAVAAVLVAVIGVGGFLTLNHFAQRGSIPATEPADSNSSLTDSTKEAVPSTETRLQNDYFTKVTFDDKEGFSDGLVRIWQENDCIQKETLDTGKVETLFSVINDSGTKRLEAVTSNRLYFGVWSKTNSYDGTMRAYSVNYENGDKSDLGVFSNTIFRDGWIAIEGATWNDPLLVIDCRDRAVVCKDNNWGYAIAGDCVYYIHCPAVDENYSLFQSTPGTASGHIQYELRKVDRDGNVTLLGSFVMPFIRAPFHIDAEADEISSDELVEILDLNTLQVKGYRDAAVPDLVPVDPETLVSEAMFIQGTYTDACDNVYNCSYSIPRLNADTPDAAAINQEIDSKYGELARYVQSLEDGNESLICPTVKYSVTVWQDVVTTVITSHCNWGFDEYDVYCYDCSTGRRLNTSALLRKMGITPDEFLEACTTRFYEKFDSLYENYTDGLEGEELENTIAARAEYREAVATVNYVNLSLQAYPAENGSITVVGPIVSMAGADFYDYLIDLGRLGEN